MQASQTAVVLIEFQNEFCKQGGKLYDMVKDEMARLDTVTNAVNLAKKAREKGCLLIHCPFVYDERWAEEHQVCGIIAEAAKQGAFRPGQWGTEFIQELTPAEDDEVLSGKHALSAFTNTQLAQILEARGIKNLAVAGFLSNVCVEGTARTAYDHGYRVQVIKDAVAAGSRATQEYVEREIYPLLGGSMTGDQFIEALD